MLQIKNWERFFHIARERDITYVWLVEDLKELPPQLMLLADEVRIIDALTATVKLVSKDCDPEVKAMQAP